MKLKEIYERAIEYGKEADPRGKKGVLEELLRVNENFQNLSKDEKEEFDKERLINPYADSRIVYGEENTDVKTVMVGIDIGVSELILADRLREKGTKIDAVISHHPLGKALAGFFNVMGMQADILLGYGVPISVAESLLEERIKEVERKIMPTNFMRPVDAAKLLNIPLLCIHTPADNQVVAYLSKLFGEKTPLTVRDIMTILKQVYEYRHGAEENFPPKIVVGNENRRAGKIFVDMTGGTEGSKKVFRSLTHRGISTIVGMHFSEEHIKEAEAEKLNVIIAGHISSDNLGLNLLLDKIFEKDKEIVIPCSGFRRYSRLKKT